MVTPHDIQRYYELAPLNIPEQWNLSRKHIRIVLRDGRFIKLNRLRHRINVRSLRYFCAKYAPIHVYFSVLDWIFPERVSRKHKAKYAVPIGGEYVIDVDSHNVWVPHNHSRWQPICTECLYISKDLTLHLCEAIEETYRNIQIVFSSRRGFHIHVLDFNYRDWTYYNPRNPIKSHEVARFKYTRSLAWSRHGFNRPHFIVSTDPMRVVSIPYSLNGTSELVCLPIGNRKALENLSIESLVARARYYAHPELYESVFKLRLADTWGE